MRAARVLLPALALVLGPWAAYDASAEPIGFLAAARGDVQIERLGTAAWQAARLDGEIEIGDTLRTGPDANAKILLVDDTLLQIDEETELQIESWHVGSAATREPSIVRQVRGRLRATVGDAFGGSTRLEVHTPTAAVGVKGTDFEVVKATLWEACLISGGIVVSNAFGSASPAPGQCVYAYGDKAPGDAFPNPRAPLSVEGRGPAVADSDFEEAVRPDVAAGGTAPDGDLPAGDDSDQNREDEFEPHVDRSEVEQVIDPGVSEQDPIKDP
jgi:hypothetical protein